MKYGLKVLAFSIITSIIFLSTSTAVRASTTVSFGVYPPKIIISSPPHQNIQVPIKLVNGGEIQTLKFSASSIKANEDGSVELTNDQDEAFAWLTIDNTLLPKYEVKLNPSEEKSVVLNIKVPSNALYNDHYFAVLIYTENSEEYSSSFTKSLAQIAIPVILSIKEKSQPESLQVEKFDIPNIVIGNAVPILLKVKNPDTYFVSVEGTITLTPTIGKKSQTALSKTEILSNQTRTIGDNNFKITSQALGPTKVSIQIPLYGSAGLTLEKRVLIIPKFIIYVIIFIILLPAFILIKTILSKANNSRKIK